MRHAAAILLLLCLSLAPRVQGQAVRPSPPASWGTLPGKPTTLAGYGITDGVSTAALAIGLADKAGANDLVAENIARTNGDAALGVIISGVDSAQTAALAGKVSLSGSYADPAWITSLAKSKVGLGSVENTALSTWAGSTNLTTLGTITIGTVPVARVSGLGTLATQSGTFSGTSSGTNTGDQINISGSAATLSATLPINKGGTNAITAPAARVSLGMDAYTAVADANYTALATDRVISWTSITAARVLTLPAASALNAGQELIIGDISGACSASNTITITRAGSDTIDGAATEVIAAAYAKRRLISDGVSKWGFDKGVARTALANTWTATQPFAAITATTINGHTFTSGSSTFTGTAGKTYTFPTQDATLTRLLARGSPLFWGSASTVQTVTGSGTTSTNDWAGNVQTGSTASSRAQRAWPTTIGSVFLGLSGSNPANMDWQQPCAVLFSVSLISTSTNATLWVRAGDGATTSGDLAARGLQLKITNLSVTAGVHNGTTLTSSGTLLTAATSQNIHVAFYSLGSGSVQVWINDALATTLSGGPSTAGVSSFSVVIEALNNADASSARMQISPVKILLL